MANTRQSTKRARQSVVRRLRGQAFRSRCRTLIKKASHVATTDSKSFGEAFTEMQTVLDRAVSKRFLHRNTVARIKRRVNKFAASQRQTAA